MDKINLGALPVSSDQAMFETVLNVRIREYKLRLVVWTLFALPLWLLSLGVIVWFVLYPPQPSYIFLSLGLALMNIGAFGFKPKALFDTPKKE